MLYTFVLDLKLGNDGCAKVLEMQQPLNSGTVGYEQAYNQCIIRDVIMPFYAETFNVPIVNVDPRAYRTDVATGGAHLINLSQWNRSKACYEDLSQLPQADDFDPNITSSYSAILSPFYYEGYYSSHIQVAKQPHIAVVNDHGLFNGIANSKFLQHIFLSPLIGDLAMKETVIKTSTPERMARKIKQEVPSDKVVLKIPSESQGRGVIVVEQEKLVDTLSILFMPHENVKDKDLKEELRNRGLSSVFNHRDWRLGEWRNQAHFVVQEYVESKPIRHEDGKDYDATMRVLGSVWLDKEGSKCEIHGGYWKFPEQAITGQLSASQMVSASPTLMRGMQVSDKDMACVTKQIEPIFADALYKLHRIHGVDIARKVLKKDDDMLLDALMGYIRYGRDNSFLDDLNETEMKCFARKLAEKTISSGALYPRSASTGMPSLPIGFGYCMRCTEEGLERLKKSYSDYITKNRHRLPEEHPFRSPQNKKFKPS